MMNNRKKKIKELIATAENFSISAESRYVESNFEVFHFDFKEGIVYIHSTSKNDILKFKKVYAIPNKKGDGIRLAILQTVLNVPPKNAIQLDFLLTGTVRKII